MSSPMTLEQATEHAQDRILAAATAEWDTLVSTVEAAFADFAGPAAPTNLVPTPDASIWYDPATGALVRIPTGARTAVAS